MAEQQQNGGRHPLLNEELLAKAGGYLDTCKDTYRRYDEVAENEDMEEICEDRECDQECGKVHEDLESPTRPKRRYRSLYQSRTRLQVELPSIAGLALYLGITRETVHDWRDKAETDVENGLYKRFSYIIGKVLAEQEQRLVSKGVSGEYNPTIAKLLLTKHGYSDKTDITSGDKPIQATPEAQALAATAIDSFFKNNGNTEPPATPGQ